MSTNSIGGGSTPQVNLSGSMEQFQAGGTQLSRAGTGAASEMGGDMMGQIQQTSAMQMRFQTEMGILQMMVKMNEALAKLFKAIGEAIKGLA